jgi:hypothetical protein
MAKCGHINKHAYGVDGKPIDLKCELEEGHTGNHRAMHKQKTTKISATLSAEDALKFKQVEENGKTYYVAELPVEWNDMAGTPVDEIVPGSPGVQVIQSDFAQPAQVADLKKRVAELEKLLKK